MQNNNPGIDIDNKGEVVLYNPNRGLSNIEVKLLDESVWLTQRQISELFGKDVKTIQEHLKNIYLENELEHNPTTRKFRIVQKERNREVSRELIHYNLDAILSVGYRVSSKKGTQFRIWATKTLKDHIVQGYTLNEKRLAENKKNLDDLQKSIKFMQKALEYKNLNLDEAKGLLKIISDYTNTWILLNKFDHNNLSTQKKSKVIHELEYKECQKAIENLKKDLITREEAGDIFGQEVSEKFKAIIGNVNQSIYGKYSYPTVEEKAAHILYFIIKDHPFTDGNKRIASMLFLYFLELNNYLYNQNGSTKINDTTLVALALLIAMSKPIDKTNLINLITNIL